MLSPFHIIVLLILILMKYGKTKALVKRAEGFDRKVGEAAKKRLITYNPKI